jgi:hypothetical protein
MFFSYFYHRSYTSFFKKNAVASGKTRLAD